MRSSVSTEEAEAFWQMEDQVQAPAPKPEASDDMEDLVSMIESFELLCCISLFYTLFFCMNLHVLPPHFRNFPCSSVHHNPSTLLPLP